jgi:hypothetical protein
VTFPSSAAGRLRSKAIGKGGTPTLFPQDLSSTLRVSPGFMEIHGGTHATSVSHPSRPRHSARAAANSRYCCCVMPAGASSHCLRQCSMDEASVTPPAWQYCLNESRLAAPSQLKSPG